MGKYKPLILMVEDDEDVALLNTRLLTRSGYEVLLAFTASQAREYVKNHAPDLFILDVELPDGYGFDLCVELRQESDAPIMFLTGRRTPQDKLKGMSLGGDYYITKPFDRDEFLGMVQILLDKAIQNRKKVDNAVARATVITRGSLTLNISQSKAYVGGRDAELTQKEFAVLLMLVQNEDKELTSEVLYKNVWGVDMNKDTGTIRVHMSNLKKKLDANNTDDFAILSVQGKGYIFTTV